MRMLVAVDGSEQSENAIRALAHLTQVERLIVLHAVDVPRPAYPMMLPDVAQGLYTVDERTMRESGEALLKRVVTTLPPQIGPVTTKLEIGSPADRILDVAKQERIELIVLGTRGLGALQEVVLGSVAHRVVAYASCPTLVVNRPMPTLRSILLAVEGPQEVDAAIRFLSQKPFRHPVELTVFTVLPLAQPLWPVGVSDSESLREKALKSAWCFVWDVAGRLSGFGFPAGALVGMGAPANAILQQAAALKADLIMIGSHGKRGVSRFLLGSVSHGVLHRATSPVLVVR